MVKSAKLWYKTLTQQNREVLFGEMRKIDKIIEKLRQKYMELSPKYGEIAVGGAHMDSFFEMVEYEGFLRGLRKGNDPSFSLKLGLKDRQAAIIKWNRQREWQVHRHIVEYNQQKLIMWAKALTGLKEK